MPKRRYVTVLCGSIRRHESRKIAEKKARHGIWRKVNDNVYEEIGDVQAPVASGRVAWPAKPMEVFAFPLICDALPGRAILPPPPGWHERMRHAGRVVRQ